MMNSKPPFRADHVGSLLRPPELLRARDRFKNGEISAPELRSIEDASILGAVRGIDPETGHYFDDTKRYIDALKLRDGDRHKIFEGNARRVYPRLDRLLKRRF